MFRFVVLTALVAVATAGPGLRRVPMLDGRIVGGEDTTIEDHPYQLSLQSYGSHICGASIISSNKALTAAHCTDGSSASSLTVRASSTSRGSGGEVIQVASICQNPDYDWWYIDFDDSVLVLAADITLGAGAQPIKVPAVGVEVPVGDLATVTGWGTTSSGGSLPTILQAVQVPRVDDAACNSAYDGDVTARMICFGLTEGGKDSCQGDSGGPLVWNGEVHGIVSWGMGCAMPNYPGVYAKPSEANINAHINRC